MEYKIGEIVTLPDGRKVEVVEVSRSSCDMCVFVRGEFNCILDDMIGIVGDCTLLTRTDHKNIIYKEIKEE